MQRIEDQLSNMFSTYLCRNSDLTSVSFCGIIKYKEKGKDSQIETPNLKPRSFKEESRRRPTKRGA